MTIPDHERLRDALTALSGDAAIVPAVSSAGVRSGWWTSGRTWRRTYGRLTAHAVAFADLVFASEMPSPELCRVEVFDCRPDDPRTHRDVCIVESEIGWMFQSALAGQPASDGLRSDRSEELARRIGTAAASLACATVQAADVFDGAAQMRRSRRRPVELTRRVPRLSATVTFIVDRLEELHARGGTREPGPIHGAPHPDQWLDDGNAIGLIDFDRFSRGDPEMDTGILLGDLDAIGPSTVPAASLAAAVLDGYRAAHAIRPDGDRKAEQLAMLVEQTLSAAVVV
jgi:Phosphotransferase enzyme family